MEPLFKTTAVGREFESLRRRNMKCKNYKKIKGCDGVIVWHTYDPDDLEGVKEGCLGKPIDYLCETCGIFTESADTLCCFSEDERQEIANRKR